MRDVFERSFVDARTYGIVSEVRALALAELSTSLGTMTRVAEKDLDIKIKKT